MKHTKNFLIIILLVFLGHTSARATQIFVSPEGDDGNAGTIEQPLRSVQKAQELLSPGDTVYIRGGTYTLTEEEISRVENNLFACISFLNKSGEENARINYWAYPGEQPVFDMHAVKPAGQRVVCFWVSGNYIHLKGLEITGVQITILEHTESYCVYSWGNHNIFENISMHHNKGTGLRHRKGGYNLFLNCDSWYNHDDVSENKIGDNVDGFGCHPTKGGKGNVFRGCRAWFNSDDGFDCIRSSESIVFENCWAGYNGYSASMQRLGDGNGFKIGGYAYDEESKIPDPIPRNDVRFCLAVHNKSNGFYSNHHLTGNTWINNSAYMNAVNFNMVNRESPQSQNINANGYDHVLINNLGYKGRSGETQYLDTSQNDVATNSFDMDFILSDNDFVSLDESALMGPRKPDGSLPDIDFMQINPASPLMDAGTDAGYPFYGDAPEPGAFEQQLPKVVGIDEVFHTNYSFYPNPAKEIIHINSPGFRNVWLTNLAGKQQQIKQWENSIDVSGLKNGVYIVSIVNGDDKISSEKLVICK